MDHLNGRFPPKDMGVVYVYFDYQDQERQKPSSIRANFLKQLFCRLGAWPTEIEKTYSDSIKSQTRPGFENLLSLLNYFLASSMACMF